MKYKKTFLLIFLATIFWGSVWVIGAQAEGGVGRGGQMKFVPNITIPGGSGFANPDGVLVTRESNLIAEYISAVYDYGARLGSVIAMFMLVLAGWKWLMAGGNSQKITSAKEMITGALIGLALLFGGYLLLNQISKNLVSFDNLNLPAIETIYQDEGSCNGYHLAIKELNTFKSAYIAATDPVEKEDIRSRFNVRYTDIIDKFAPQPTPHQIDWNMADDTVSMGYICGFNTTINSDIGGPTGGRRVKCIGNDCSGTDVCVIRSSIQLCPSTALTYGSGFGGCHCASTECEVLFDSSGGNNEDCDASNFNPNYGGWGYRDIVSCMANKCYGTGAYQTTRPCGVERGKRDEGNIDCQDLDSIVCSTNSDCGDITRFCCRDLGLARPDKCGPISDSACKSN
ncbi:pilin [bacterium]|nr:pilin [bacterium]